ncbi:hypothetical protein JCGZ_15500 [Jatropha curcas]|uniref:Uncharacterized protein n=1 Tax=Jatropha curcas TaxID=180498 RepID=A0A067K3T6_JATCU|nr:hypothetical protein JCGZ_15500 [Jatropha curcas]
MAQKPNLLSFPSSSSSVTRLLPLPSPSRFRPPFNKDEVAIGSFGDTGHDSSPPSLRSDLQWHRYDAPHLLRDAAITPVRSSDSGDMKLQVELRSIPPSCVNDFHPRNDAFAFPTIARGGGGGGTATCRRDFGEDFKRQNDPLFARVPES